MNTDVRERIERYIKRTNMQLKNASPYHMNVKEMLGLSAISQEDAIGALCLAFSYGQAKGYRAAKAEVKK